MNFVAYIDEAGDEGFGKLASGNAGGQSHWLIIGACVVTAAEDVKLPALRNKISSRLSRDEKRPIHFRDLKHAQKIVACQEIAKSQARFCVTLSHKTTIPGSRFEAIFKKRGYLYNYLVRWLLERLTAHCAKEAGINCKLRLVFSRRANTDYETMKDYLILMRDGREQIQPVRSINWRVLDVEDISVESHSKWAGLQIADCATSAFFMAVEPNSYGNYEPAYANILRDNMIRAGASALNSGVTPVPSFYKCGADAQQLEFFKSFAK